jgi:hypothetical protein
MEIFIDNFFSPIVLSFLLGIIACFVKSELSFPEPVLRLIAIYLLLSIGLKGGRELSQVSLYEVSSAILATVVLIVLLPIIAYAVARYLGKFDHQNAGGIAALYGSVSSVTFLASINYAQNMGTPSEGYITALTAFMELSILVAIFIARWQMGKENETGSFFDTLKETLRSRGLILLSGGLFIGFVIGPEKYEQIAPFYEDLFRGFLMLFLLEMGMVAAKQMKDFLKVGPFMLAFGVAVPVIHGLIGVGLGTLAGLSVGGAFVFGTVAASASYIDAPAAVRASLPDANPGIYLTSSLGITFPFNLLVGIPLYYEFSKLLHAVIA